MAVSGGQKTRIGIGQALGISLSITAKNSSVAAGGVFNAAEFFPTGQVDVVITLYDPEVAGAIAIPLDSDVCVEVGSTGLYMWDMSKITTLPTPRKEYGYLMTDGSTSQGGVIMYDDFLVQYLIHNEYGI
jgi:hypothetical protein